MSRKRTNHLFNLVNCEFNSLLLNNDDTCISIIDTKKVHSLIKREKVDIIEYWNDNNPALLKLKYKTIALPQSIPFSRNSIFKRDQKICQYCAKELTWNQLTMDHVFPTSRGGKSSWLNCVTACQNCNTKKGNLTPEEAGMPLLNEPYVAVLTVTHCLKFIEKHHESWAKYIHRPSVQ